jgi:hypothetical protein
MSYLLETYCNFKYEFPDDMKKAILDNWLVNLRGTPGCFVEMDLMQEHFNFWLEKMAQHKGKDFDDPFYRDVISASVLWFLRLKDEMEENVSLHPRSKKHTEGKLIAELRAAKSWLRQHEIHKRRPGRSYGWEAQDDFSLGYEALQGGKLKDFLIRTTMYIDQKETARAPGLTDDVAGVDFTEDDIQTAEGDITEEGAHVLNGTEPPSMARAVGHELCL